MPSICAIARSASTLKRMDKITDYLLGESMSEATIRGMDHIGITVPDIKQATVDSICQCNTPFNYLFRCFELQCLSRSVV